jgi:hypothetical protein
MVYDHFETCLLQLRDATQLGMDALIKESDLG